MPDPGGRSRWRRPHAAIAAFLFVVGLLASCSDTNRSAEAFCAQLATVTGPTGAEVTLITGDPDRVPAVVEELRSLLDRAPEDIATTTRTLYEFFDTYQRSPRDQRRQLLLDNEARLSQASTELDGYALRECGLFLQRAVPTPIETSDPGIEVAPE